MQIRQHAHRLAIALVFAVVSAPASGAAQETAAPSKKPAAPARTPDVIFVPTPREVVDQMLAVARVGKNDVVYDLGSGDGRIVITAAQRFGLRGMGVDLDPDRIQEANANAKQAGVTDRVRFVRQDLFKTDLREASIVTLYLLPRVNLELRPRLFEQLRPGTRVVSHAFSMEDWEPDSVVTRTSAGRAPPKKPRRGEARTSTRTSLRAAPSASSARATAASTVGPVERTWRLIVTPLARVAYLLTGSATGRNMTYC